MKTDDTLGPLVLLTTSDPEQCAQALLHMVSTLPASGAVLRVVAHGAAAAACQQVAHQLLDSAGLQVSIGQGDSAADAVNQGSGLGGWAGAMYVLSDDVRVSPGWLEELAAVAQLQVVHAMGDHVLQEYHRIGMVGPCLDQTTSRAQRIQLAEAEVAMGSDGYAAARLEHFQGGASQADLLDGCCVMLTHTAVADGRRAGCLLDPDMGSWAWADLCLHLADMGFRLAVSEGTYVARTHAVPAGQVSPGTVTDRLAFYAKHPQPVHCLVAVIVAPLSGWHNLQLLRDTLRSIAPLVDGVAVLVGGDPAGIANDYEYASAMAARSVAAVDNRLIKGCQGVAAEAAEDAVRAWVQDALSGTADRRVGRLSVRCRLWRGEGTNMAQRNAGLLMAASLDAGAVLMLDYDEVLDTGVTRAHLDRLLQHPNPLANSWDLGIVYHWDTATLVREDGTWGHAGTYKAGPHGVRLQRLRGGRTGKILPGNGVAALPDAGPASQRIASLSLRRFRMARATDRVTGPAVSTEGMRLSARHGHQGTGLHMLVYEGEDPEDVARWLDQVHGLVDHVVLVWTGDGHPVEAAEGASRALMGVAAAHGCQWVHQPLDDDFAQARNAGIQALHDRGGLRWAWFTDPDEWMGDHLADGVALRNMASSDRWGWLLQVVNYRVDQEVPTISDSVRISRLDLGGQMRMDGRVHEGFHAAIHQLQAKQIHPRLVYAPFMLHQRGMALDASRMDGKLVQYEHLLRRELDDNPHNPGAWISLGWHYYNDGHDGLGLECYRRGVACAGNSYLPYKEMAYHHLRQARLLMDECDARLVGSHQFAPLAKQMRQWLGKYAPPHPVIERTEQRPPAALPEWSAPAIPGASGYDGA